MKNKRNKRHRRAHFEESDHGFHVGWTILGFIGGLVISAGIIGLILAFGLAIGLSGVSPPVWLSAAIWLGFVIALVLPFGFAYWLGKPD